MTDYYAYRKPISNTSSEVQSGAASARFGRLLHFLFLWPAILLAIGLVRAFSGVELSLVLLLIASVFGPMSVISAGAIGAVMLISNPDRRSLYNFSLMVFGAVVALACLATLKYVGPQ